MKKICSKCNIEKSLEEFHKHKHTKDGVDTRCKICKKQNYKIINRFIPIINNQLTCLICNKLKNITEFSQTKTGTVHSKYCKSCKNNYNIKRNAIKNIEQLCPICKNIRYINRAIQRKILTGKSSGRCASCSKTVRCKPHLQYNNKRIKIYDNQNINHTNNAKYYVLNQYMKRAKERELSFELTSEEFFTLSQQPCHYCGKILTSNKKMKYNNFMYNGIDRIDNTIGYTQYNCVSACKHCNLAKRDTTYTSFISVIKNIYEHLNLANVNTTDVGELERTTNSIAISS